MSVLLVSAPPRFSTNGTLLHAPSGCGYSVPVPQDLSLRERRENPARCAYCHDDAGATPVECPRCSTLLHAECAVARKCPTLGCTHDFTSPANRTAVAGADLRHARLTHAAEVLFGVVAPLAAFFFNEGGIDRELMPRSQKDAFWKMLYAAGVQRCFYPLLLWAMVACLARTFGYRASWIRQGLRGGLVLALLFAALYVPMLPSAAVGIMLMGIGLLGFTPYMASLAYFNASRTYDDDLPEGERRASVPTLVWWAATAVSGLGAWLEMQRRFRELPATYTRDCYLCTVAARGDRRVTGSELVRLRDGRELLVSKQLRRFKAAELVLAARAPRVHGAVRAVYDRVGPRLAARVTPRGATLLHVAFKPAELAVALALRVLVRDRAELLARTYRGY